jgi:hypothetical protein
MPSVFLNDILEVFKPTTRSGIQTQLQGYFDRVGAALNPKEPITVSWSNTLPAVKPEDLILYYCPTEYSVVGEFSGEKFDPLSRAHWGYTFMKGDSNETASEVYAKNLLVDTMAKLAFHELMHNKLHMGADLHKKNGLASATVDDTTDLTPQNITDMAAVIKRARPQWTGGYAKLASRKDRRDHGDDFWYM